MEITIEINMHISYAHAYTRASYVSVLEAGTENSAEAEIQTSYLYSNGGSVYMEL